MAPRPPFTLLRALHQPHIRLKPPAPRHPAQIPNRALPRSASSSAHPNTVEGATDISHSAFISSASPDSDFNPLQTPSPGQDTVADDRRGHLSPTNSHLFKLILPLPTSLTSYKPPAQPTAFLLHPSQPLSHLSRLISGSLPPSERNVEITYLALTGPEESIDSHLRNAEDEEGVAERSEGGPFLGERSSRDGKWQEVSWSSSTDLSDFIKQSCLNERFKINIKPESPAEGKGGEEGRAATEVEKEGLTMEVVIPSFASRTTYLRARLLKLTKELDQTTKQKKAIDLAAHKGAQRLAVMVLGVGVAYWVAIIRWTFFTDAGWDLMEPVTWATGFGTLLCSAAFLVYHNREVSYSSLLDLSVTARQQRLYDHHGLDIDKWTEMVAEAKTLRREIARVAADYDLEWKGELENLARDSEPLENRLKSKSESKQSHQPKEGEVSKDESHDDSHIDIDKTIDEASEMASESKEKKEKEKSAQRKGEVMEAQDESMEEKAGDESVERGREKARKVAEKK